LPTQYITHWRTSCSVCRYYKKKKN